MRTIVLNIVLLTMTGCISYGPGNGASGSAMYPTDWPPPSAGEFGPNECVHLDGVYLSSGESNSTLGDRFINPVFEKNFFGLDEIAGAKNRFRIEHDENEQKLIFEFQNPEGELLSSGHVKNYARCEHGWVVNESYSRGGSGDNPTVSQKEISRRFLAQDGSLISSHFTETVTSRFFIARETQTAEIWYRFKSAE
ncbi:MAG: hypothetical protein HKN15_10745 [Xanthomonadales bacterium]|nr:hypothetical protein [Xanthomonadales bacterium]